MSCTSKTKPQKLGSETVNGQRKWPLSTINPIFPFLQLWPFANANLILQETWSGIWTSSSRLFVVQTRCKKSNPQKKLHQKQTQTTWPTPTMQLVQAWLYTLLNKPHTASQNDESKYDTGRRPRDFYNQSNICISLQHQIYLGWFLAVFGIVWGSACLLRVFQL